LRAQETGFDPEKVLTDWSGFCLLECALSVSILLAADSIFFVSMVFDVLCFRVQVVFVEK
jgi:hypothetical protein